VKENSSLKYELQRIIQGVVKFNEPLRNHTSFHIGGPADIFIVPLNQEDLRNAVILSKKYRSLLIVIGNGTKILVLDNGVRGIVTKISNVLNEVRFIKERVIAGSGMSLSQLSILTAEKGLSGLEFAIGIPGTVGGAVVMNAGAHGWSVGDVITSVTIMDMNGQVHKVSNGKLKFGYRESVLQDAKAIVLNATFKLKREEAQEIQRKIAEFVRWRKKTQPLNLPNAGSIFRNPEKEYAGRLIDAAGLKGLRVGDAQVSTQHANFIVNLGKAKAEDLMTIMHTIKEKVHEKFGINLTPEIRIIGER
jgi:UDP-N-acetylmuramate dehydrogenase